MDTHTYTNDQEQPKLIKTSKIITNVYEWCHTQNKNTADEGEGNLLLESPQLWKGAESMGNECRINISGAFLLVFH